MNRALPLLLIAACAAYTANAQSDLGLSFTTSEYTVTAGQTAQIDAELINLTIQSLVHINGVRLDVPVTYLDINASPLLLAGPGALDPGERWSGTIFTLIAPLGATEGSYTAKVTIYGGRGEFDEAVLLETFLLVHVLPGCNPASITDQPTSQSGCRDGTAAFSVAAVGTDPFTYQWRKEGVPIDAASNPSAAAPTLVLAMLQSADAGAYDCVVTDGCNLSTTTNSAVLVVCACLACPADFNQDGGIDGGDLDTFFGAWQMGSCDADVNADGGVDGADVDTFFAAWEAGECG
ncbi:MAG: hypothetical protein JSR77_01860 [Planctomycetes bacterium]|nr:hypothetical protein [Planctomycetota bacterium]